jgi:branched-chain amino acid transport system substrate-binding protein
MIMTLKDGFLAGLAWAALGLAAAQAADLPIGAIGSLSGGATAWGVATQRGAQMAIDEVVKAGGLKIGSETYIPRLVIYDDQYSGQGGAAAATRLVNADKVKFIVGPIGTPPVLSSLSVTGPAKVLELTDGFSPKVLSPASTYNFRVSVTTEEFAPAMVHWLHTNYKDAKRVAIIGPSDAVGQQVVPILERVYKAEGFEIPFSEKFERGTADFSPILTRIMATGVDVLELDSNAPAESGLLLKQARQLGFKGVILQTGGPSMEENMAVAGPLAEGFITFDFLDPDNALAKQFAETYAKTYPGVLSPWAPVIYNATRLLFEAMRRANSVDVDAVRQELPKLDGLDTVFGPVHWGGMKTYGIDHQLMIDFIIEQVRDGKIARVAKVSTQ